MSVTKHHRVFAAMGILLASAALGQTPPPAPPSNPQPTRLAVVNIIDVFSKLNEKMAVDDTIQKMSKDYDEQMAAKKKELDALQADLEAPALVSKGSAAYRAEQDEFMEKTIDLQAFQSKIQQKVFLEQRLQTMLIYRKMVAAIEAYSQAKGIALVFAIDNIDIISGAPNSQELNNRIIMRKVLYAAPSFDITQDIVAKMNNEYNSAPAKGAP